MAARARIDTSKGEPRLIVWSTGMDTELAFVRNTNHTLTDDQVSFWVGVVAHNLRTKGRRQVGGRLRGDAGKGVGYCCLGSATLDIKQAGGGPIGRNVCDHSLANNTLLDHEVAGYLGTDPDGTGIALGNYGKGQALSSLNDEHGLTFRQIADVIEFSLTGTVKRLAPAVAGGDDA